MFGGVIIGFILDMPYLSRPKRAMAGWIFTFVTGMAIMGGGLAFENWFEGQELTRGAHFIVSGLACPREITNRTYLALVWDRFDSGSSTSFIFPLGFPIALINS